MIRMALFASLIIVATTAVGIAQTTSPYSGQEQRTVKALSEEEIRDLMEARGMGLAIRDRSTCCSWPTSLGYPTRSARRPIRSMRICGNGLYPLAARSSRPSGPWIAPLRMARSGRRRFSLKSVRSRPCRAGFGAFTWRRT